MKKQSKNIVIAIKKNKIKTKIIIFFFVISLIVCGMNYFIQRDMADVNYVIWPQDHNRQYNEQLKKYYFELPVNKIYIEKNSKVTLDDIGITPKLVFAFKINTKISKIEVLENEKLRKATIGDLTEGMVIRVIGGNLGKTCCANNIPIYFPSKILIIKNL